MDTRPEDLVGFGMSKKPTEKQIEHAIATMKLDPDDKNAREALAELLGQLKTEEVYDWLEKIGPMKYAYVPEYHFPKGLLTEYQASLRPPRAYEIRVQTEEYRACALARRNRSEVQVRGTLRKVSRSSKGSRRAFVPHGIHAHHLCFERLAQGT